MLAFQMSLNRPQRPTFVHAADPIHSSTLSCAGILRCSILHMSQATRYGSNSFEIDRYSLLYAATRTIAHPVNSPLMSMATGFRHLDHQGAAAHRLGWYCLAGCHAPFTMAAICHHHLKPTLRLDHGLSISHCP